MALLIKVDGTEEEVKGTDKGGKFGLQQLYQLIECDMVQLVHVKLDYKGTKYNELWCDEDGKLNGKRPNGHATSLVQGQLLPGDDLVGNILLVGTRKKNGSR